MADFLTLTITKGDDAGPILHVTKDGAPFDVTGMTVTWQAASTHESADPELGPYTCTLSDPDQGVVTVPIPHADTAALTDSAYLWDMKVTDLGGKIVHVARGVLHVLEGVGA